MSSRAMSEAEMYGSEGQTRVRLEEPPDAFRSNGATAPSEQFANALGWLSLGLGLAGLAAPQVVARLVGVRDSEENQKLVRLVGAREIVSGLGILSQARPAGWVWSRVAGDVMDLSLLGTAMRSDDTDRTRAAAAAAVVAGIAVVDALNAQQLSAAPSTPEGRAVRDYLSRVKAITINRPVEEVYRHWRRLENLPRFMSQLESIDVLSETRSRWCARGPGNVLVEWDAEITDDRPNERIAWRSLPGSQVETSGWVRFDAAPRGRGTEVRVEIQYSPPGGGLGAAVAKLFNKDPESQLEENLRHFKQVLETGDVVRSDGSMTTLSWPQHAAQPLSTREMSETR
ncbi:MAG: SRPBCC family protein [Armatimonadota bacterium]